MATLRQLAQRALQERDQEHMLRQQAERRSRHLQSDTEALGERLDLQYYHCIVIEVWGQIMHGAFPGVFRIMESSSMSSKRIGGTEFEGLCQSLDVVFLAIRRP